MKKTSHTFLCVVLAILLVAGGLGFGARRGWQEEKDKVQAAYASETGLKAVLELRAADAHNLQVVAGRHLDASHPLIKALNAARETLLRQDASLSQKYRADQDLSRAVEQLEKELSTLPSMKDSVRDQNYLTTLTGEMNSLSQNAAIQAYNQAAEDYNRRRQMSLSGFFAGFMGVGDAQVFAAK